MRQIMFIHSFILKGFIEPQLFAEPAWQGYKNDKHVVPEPLQLRGCSETLLHLDEGRRA